MTNPDPVPRKAVAERNHHTRMGPAEHEETLVNLAVALRNLQEGRTG